MLCAFGPKHEPPGKATALLILLLPAAQFSLTVFRLQPVAVMSQQTPFSMNCAEKNTKKVRVGVQISAL